MPWEGQWPKSIKEAMHPNRIGLRAFSSFSLLSMQLWIGAKLAPGSMPPNTNRREYLKAKAPQKKAKQALGDV
jgi:hypothetical protein